MGLPIGLSDNKNFADPTGPPPSPPRARDGPVGSAKFLRYFIRAPGRGLGELAPFALLQGPFHVEVPQHPNALWTGPETIRKNVLLIKRLFCSEIRKCSGVSKNGVLGGKKNEEGESLELKKLKIRHASWDAL